MKRSSFSKKHSTSRSQSSTKKSSVSFTSSRKKKVQICDKIQPPSFQFNDTQGDEEEDNNRYELWAMEIPSNTLLELSQLAGMDIDFGSLEPDKKNNKPLFLNVHQDKDTTRNNHPRREYTMRKMDTNELQKQSNDYALLSHPNKKTTLLRTVPFQHHYKIEAAPNKQSRLIKAPGTNTEIKEAQFKVPYTDVAQISIEKKRWSVTGSANGGIMFRTPIPASTITMASINAATNAMITPKQEQENIAEEAAIIPVEEDPVNAKSKRKRKHKSYDEDNEDNKEEDRKKRKREKKELKKKKKERRSNSGNVKTEDY